MIRNVKLIFSTNALMLLSGVVTSLLSAWALGPAGRGDLAVVVLWPNAYAMLVEIGLPQAHRYWAARRLESTSALFSNAVCFTLVVGCIALGLAEWIIPHLVGERSPEVMWLVRLYLLVVPVALCFDLMRGLLEGARRFGWVGAARVTYFGVQAGGYLALYFGGWLTVASATYVMIASAVSAMLLSLVGVWRELRPSWGPSRSALGTALRYGVRDYPGVVTEFTTLRLDQFMLGGMASSVAIGLYFVSVRLAEITATLASSVADALMPEMAASKRADEATRLLARSLRLTLYAQLCLLIPLWVAAPVVLRVVYGEGFLAATATLRLLLIASVIWSAGAIVISGLNGFGHPGLSTVARLAAATVTVVALLYWLPRRGIVGAALASLAGYSVMLVVALFWLLRRRQLGLWECLRPRWDDIPLARLKLSFGLLVASFKS